MFSLTGGLDSSSQWTWVGLNRKWAEIFSYTVHNLKFPKKSSCKNVCLNTVTTKINIHVVFVPQLLAARVVNQDRTFWDPFVPKFVPQDSLLWTQTGIPLIICEAMSQAAVSEHADNAIPSGVLYFVHGHVSDQCSYHHRWWLQQFEIHASMISPGLSSLVPS